MKHELSPHLRSIKWLLPGGLILFTLSSLAVRTWEQAKLRHAPVRSPASAFYEQTFHFEENRGQAADEVDFLCHSGQHILFLGAAGSSLHVLGKQNGDSAVALHMSLRGAAKTARPRGCDALKSYSNYYLGGDPGTWLEQVPHFARVAYEDIYDGIDLVYHSRENQVEFDFFVAPGADPKKIRLDFTGVDQLKKDGKGNLLLHARGHELICRTPQAWQESEGRKQQVDVQFALLADHSVRFEIAPYDRLRPLTIDPQIVYATYLGGSDTDTGTAIAVDANGCAYVTGSTVSTNFPTQRPYQKDLFKTMYSNLSDVFVTKMNPEGKGIVYSTYLGGRWDDIGAAIAVDNQGRVYLTGRTSSNDDPKTTAWDGFPVKNALQPAIADPNKSDAFVTVLDSAGGLYYSSYLGGKYEDYGTGIAVNTKGHVYITGTEFSFNFPVKNAYLSQKPGYYFDAFVTVIDPALSGAASLLYSTHLGGIADTYGNAIAVDDLGRAYVTGKTSAADFPTTANVIQPAYQGNGDIFVCKFDPTKAGSASLVYSTFLGNQTSNEGLDIKVGDYYCAIVSGYGPVPPSSGAFTTASTAFISKLNVYGNGFVFSARPWSARKLALGPDGTIYTTCSAVVQGGSPGMVALKPDGSDTLFTHRLPVVPSALAADMAGNVYMTGTTSSPDLPVKNAFQSQPAGKTDAIIVKLQAADMLLVKVFADPVFWERLSVRNTQLDIYAIDLSQRARPLRFIERKFTDHKGLLRLPRGDVYEPGMPLFLRATPERVVSPKENRTAGTQFSYKVHVDNLNIDTQGKVSAQQLKINPEDTTEIFLHHASFGYSLIASIEWQASPEYVANVQSLFRMANNLLYDVTNGQAFLDSVALFDNGDRWEEADIRLYADNVQWPSAHANGVKEASGHHVYMPPAFYSNSADDSAQIQSIYNGEPIDPSIPMTVTTLVHELGHYLFNFRDEYENILGEYIFNTINFGFMDNPDDLNDPVSTEMSGYRQTDQLYNDYTLTEHFQSRARACWDYFKTNNDNIYGDIVVSIHRPRDLRIYPNNVIEGPNSDWQQPDFSVGDMMGFENHATTTTRPRLDLVFTRQNQPVKGARVMLAKQVGDRFIYHGKTTHTGRMKLFNAEAGDLVIATHERHGDWQFVERVLDAALAKSHHGAGTIEMKRLNGSYTLISEINFDAQGALVYRCQADPLFSSPPSMRFFDGRSASSEQPLSATAGGYTARLDALAFTSGDLLLAAPDRLGDRFLLRQAAAVVDRDALAEVHYFGNMPLEFISKRSKTTARKIAALSSGFPVPKKGLPDSLRRISDAIALNIFPGNSVFIGQIQIHYNADSLEALVPDAVQLYQWKDGWHPLPTGVNLTRRTAATEVAEPGIFAVFLDLTRSRVVSTQVKRAPTAPTGWMLQPNYPNPFNQNTVLSYTTPKRSRVIIAIYDVRGRKIRTLIDRPHDAGAYTVQWDGLDEKRQSAASGVYLMRLQAADVQLARKITLVR